MKLIFVLCHLITLIYTLEFKPYAEACGACLQANPRWRFTCTKCVDSSRTKDFCGINVGNLLECPRQNQNYQYCKDAYISNALIGNFEQNLYQMDKGDVCLVRVQNNMQHDSEIQGFWKIWKDDVGLQFFAVPSDTSTDDNDLDAIKDVGVVQRINKDTTKYLFIVNPTLEQKSFYLTYGKA